jgi:hypothetical protein
MTEMRCASVPICKTAVNAYSYVDVPTRLVAAVPLPVPTIETAFFKDYAMSIGEGSGSGAGTEFVTMRGRDYPSIRQFTVFLENRVGQLMDVVRRFEGSQVRIVALTISDSTECALVRFLLSDPEQGREILERAGLALVESDLIGVELPDSQQPMLQICTALLAAEVNITQIYPLLLRPNGRPAVALMVDNIEIAVETLRSKGFHAINEDELKET